MPSLLNNILLYGIESDVKKIIKKGRLIFLNNKQVHYTNKQGKDNVFTFDEFAIYIYDAEHKEERQKLGITPIDVRKILVKLYLKELEKKTGGNKW
jgi:hypothetical protein